VHSLKSHAARISGFARRIQPKVGFEVESSPLRSRVRLVAAGCALTVTPEISATGSSFLFGFRNTTQSPADFFPTSLTMPLLSEGERSGSGRLPKLRRFRICRETGGLERQVRRSRIYPNQVSCLRGHWPETPYPADHRRLTARPAVLAKRTGPGSSCFPSYEWRSGPDEQVSLWLGVSRMVSAISAFRQCRQPSRRLAERAMPSRLDSARWLWRDIGLCRPTSVPHRERLSASKNLQFRC
jgi:hypothetical protein